MNNKVSVRAIVGFIGFFISRKIAPYILKSVLVLAGTYLILLVLNALPLSLYRNIGFLIGWVGVVCIVVVVGIMLYEWISKAWKEYQTKELIKRHVINKQD